MSIAVIGVNHRTAPVEIREKLMLSGEALQTALDTLRIASEPGSSSPSAVDEAVILSTCNRLEVYISTPQVEDAVARVERMLAALRDITPAELQAYLYVHTSDDATRHLMRVASGLDSMILGESQVLGQVTQAFEDARCAGMTGPILSHLFAQAIHTGKRARTETPISRFTASVSHAGALLLQDKLDQHGTNRVLVIGAGEMAVLAAQALKRFAINDVMFVNRTYARAEALAQDFEGRAQTWYQLDEAVVWADAIICATRAPHAILYHDDIEALLPRREGRRLVILDIAVPRDVDTAVGNLPGIQYYDIDDLQSVVDANLELRKAAIPQVEEIICEEMARFAEWYRGRQVTPVIRTLREWAQSIADDELAQTLNRMPDADEHTREIVGRMAHRMVNRLLHQPTTHLRIQAKEGHGHAYAHAVSELFGLSDSCTYECQCAEPPSAVQTGSAAAPCNLECILPYVAERSE